MRVVPGLAGTAVGDGEPAIGRGYNFEVCAVGGAAFGIGDEGFGTVVRSVGALGGVEHVEVFHAGTLVDGLPRFRTAGLVRAVVHDGHTGMDRVDDGARIRLIEPVMRGEIEINMRDGIVGTHERDLPGLGEVAQVEETEFAVSDENSDGTLVLAGIRFGLWLGGAVGVGLRLDAGDGADMFSVGGEDYGAMVLPGCTMRRGLPSMALR
jgi:hypothetical protein